MQPEKLKCAFSWVKIVLGTYLQHLMYVKCYPLRVLRSSRMPKRGFAIRQNEKLDKNEQMRPNNFARLKSRSVWIIMQIPLSETATFQLK